MQKESGFKAGPEHRGVAKKKAGSWRSGSVCCGDVIEDGLHLSGLNHSFLLGGWGMSLARWVRAIWLRASGQKLPEQGSP